MIGAGAPANHHGATDPPTDEGRPPAKEAASSVNSDSHRLLPPADTLGDLDQLATSLRGYLVLQVEVDDAGHRRTTLYRSANAAQRAVVRARERGRPAHVTLCQLMPVGVVTGLEAGA